MHSFPIPSSPGESQKSHGMAPISQTPAVSALSIVLLPYCVVAVGDRSRQKNVILKKTKPLHSQRSLKAVKTGPFVQGDPVSKPCTSPNFVGLDWHKEKTSVSGLPILLPIRLRENSYGKLMMHEYDRGDRARMFGGFVRSMRSDRAKKAAGRTNAGW